MAETNRSINNVSLAGRLTSDPRETAYNLNFTVAVDRGKDKNGETLPAYFIPVQIGKNQFSQAKRDSLKKGVGVVVRGTLRNEEYTKDGQKNYFFCVAAQELWVGPVGRVNNVCIGGNLVETPEIKKTGNDNSVLNFRIGVNRAYEKDGNWTDVPSYISATAWNGTADAIAKYFDKGSPIILVGELESRNYKTKDGEDRTAYSIRVNNFSFASPKKGETVEVPDYDGGEQEDDGFTEVLDDDADFPF